MTADILMTSGGGGGCGCTDVDDGVSDGLVGHDTGNGFFARFCHGNAISTAIQFVNSDQHHHFHGGQTSEQNPDHQVDDGHRQVLFL